MFGAGPRLEFASLCLLPSITQSLSLPTCGTFASCEQKGRLTPRNLCLASVRGSIVLKRRRELPELLDFVKKGRIYTFFFFFVACLLIWAGGSTKQTHG